MLLAWSRRRRPSVGRAGAYTASARLNGARARGHGSQRRADTDAGPTPGWGLHLLDANIALGNLIKIVKAESKAFAARHHG